jgi:hypothetical protein
MKLGAAILATVLASAAGPVSAAAPSADPPPPASLAIPDVESWAAKYLQADAWTLITHDDEGAHLTARKGGRITADGLIETEVRTELFRPIQVGAGWARSGLAHWSVDCANGRFTVVSMTVFAHNNLQGKLGGKGGDPHSWISPNVSQAATLSVICAAVPGAKLPAQPLARERASPL